MADTPFYLFWFQRTGRYSQRLGLLTEPLASPVTNIHTLASLIPRPEALPTHVAKEVPIVVAATYTLLARLAQCGHESGFRVGDIGLPVHLTG